MNRVEETKLFFDKSQSIWQSKSKTSVRGHGNQHDLNNDTDLKISSTYIKNGEDNYFPFDIENVVKRSMLQKRAFKTITSIINGKIVWQNQDKSAVTPERTKFLNDLYRSIGILGSKNKKGLTKKLIDSNYLQGGSFATLQFASNGFGFELSNVMDRQYKTARLSAPIYFNDEMMSFQHFYHRNWGYSYDGRNKKKNVSPKTLSWLDWNKDTKRNFDQVCYINAYNEFLDLKDPVNRLQSYMIGDFDGLSEYYPSPSWFSGTTYNYERAEFFLSCFDVDDIENGLHASGILKVYHKAYIDPTSNEAIQTFEQQQRDIETKFKGSYNSGAISVVPVATNSNGEIVPTDGYMEFEPIKTNSNKERHEIFDKRIINKVLGANGVIMPELLGIRDEKSTLSESGTKLLNAVKLLNNFTIKPQKKLVEDFYNNIVNDLLGIEERVVIAPNLGAFLNVSDNVMQHYLHPEAWYDMYADFGVSRPSVEQIESELIPAYIKR